MKHSWANVKFFTLALDRGKWSTSRPSLLNLRERSSTHAEYEVAVAPELVWTFAEGKIFCLSQESNHNSLVLQPVALILHQM
jgi:hypothetical protein